MNTGPLQHPELERRGGQGFAASENALCLAGQGPAVGGRGRDTTVLGVQGGECCASARVAGVEERLTTLALWRGVRGASRWETRLRTHRGLGMATPAEYAASIKQGPKEGLTLSASI